MAVTIRTNHQWRDLAYRSEVPEKVLQDQFDHLSADEALDGFVEYRGHWYHTSDFMSVKHHEDLKDWHGYSSDSYFSGVLIKFDRYCERVMLATYLS
jgi:hypothetical protein